MAEVSPHNQHTTDLWRSRNAAKSNAIDKAWQEALTVRLRRFFIAKLKEYVPLIDGEKKTVLDAACGSGEVAIAAYDAGFTVTGIDVSPNLLALFHKKKEDRAIRIIEDDLFTTAHTEQYDAVTARHIIVHVNPYEQLLARLIQLTKPGGYIFFDTYSYEHLQLAANVFGVTAEAVRTAFYPAGTFVSQTNLREFCEKNHVKLVSCVPFWVFYRNALFSGNARLDKQAFERNIPKIQALYDHHDDFDLKLTQHMDPKLSCYNLNVIQVL